GGGEWRCTAGRRRGVGVAASEPLYVLATDAEENRVVVGPRAALATRTLRLEDAVVHGSVAGELEVRVRYRGRGLRGRVSGSDGPGPTRPPPPPAHPAPPP